MSGPPTLQKRSLEQSQKHKCLQGQFVPVQSPPCRVWPSPQEQELRRAFSFLHLHRFCWGPLVGPGPSLTNGGTDPHSCRTGPLTADWRTDMPWRPHPQVSKDISQALRCSPFLRATGGFFTQVLFICWPQQRTFGAYF